MTVTSPAIPRRLLEFTLDGEPVRVPEGSTILDAGRAADKDVPTVCQGDTLTLKVDNDLYVRDHDKCILWYKCVDACGAPVTDSVRVYCGNCIEVCPTGTLSFKSEFDVRAAGTWDEPAQTQTETTTVCAYCGVGCKLTLHVQDNEIVEVTSPHDNPVTHGNLCIKGRFGYQHVQNRD
jgi:predicted molibdopterin-dependent oxidoreductase YjgC